MIFVLSSEMQCFTTDDYRRKYTICHVYVAVMSRIYYTELCNCLHLPPIYRQNCVGVRVLFFNLRVFLV